MNATTSTRRKRQPPRLEKLPKFMACYHPLNRHERKELQSERSHLEAGLNSFREIAAALA